MPSPTLALLLLAAVLGCRSARSSDAPSGAPVRESGTTAPASAVNIAPTGHPADVQFMQSMIGHHAQAVLMTDMVASRTKNPAMKLLAERIAVSQSDELQLMQQWLRGHGQPVPDPHHSGHQGTAHETMPGMLTEAELNQLRNATALEFDTLFLRYMIRHHEGALTMVARLFNSAGAAQTSEVYQFATEVDGDQRAEIARMRTMLASLSR